MSRKAIDIEEPAFQYACTLMDSMIEVADFLNISYPTCLKLSRKYFMLESDGTRIQCDEYMKKKRLEKQTSQIRSIRKTASKKGWFRRARPILEVVQNPEIRSKYPEKLLLEKLQNDGYLGFHCEKCGFHRYRELDLSGPFRIHHRDFNESNWDLSNLELLCFNCYFIYVGWNSNRKVQLNPDTLEFEEFDVRFNKFRALKKYNRKKRMNQMELKSARTT